MSRDYTSYFEGWRQRSLEARRKRLDRHARAKDLLPSLVERLVTKYDARRIILVGSLASGDFHMHSDIDLVVEGLGPGRELFAALADLQDIAGSIRVEIIPWEDAFEEVRATAEREGEVLFDDRHG